jgi:hypothetical protein
MISTLTKYYIKGIITNRQLWFWGIGFMVFFLFIGAFEFGQNVTNAYSLQFTSGWYSIITVFSLSSLSITVAYTTYYASHSLAYSFRYTKLSPYGYLASVVAGAFVLGIFINAIMLAATSLIFGLRFNTKFFPANLPGDLFISALSGLFMMAFAVFLVLLVVNYLGLKNINLVSFVPLILSYAFGFAQIGSTLPSWLVYVSPYNAMIALFYMFFSGQQLPESISSAIPGNFNILYLSISLFLWIVFLLFFDAILLKRIKPRELEEARQI